jgi:hypothetical protein
MQGIPLMNALQLLPDGGSIFLKVRLKAHLNETCCATCTSSSHVCSDHGHQRHVKDWSLSGRRAQRGAVAGC